MKKMFRDKRQIIKLIFLAAVFLLPQLVFSAVSSPDAIATRVIPNPNHLSPLRWYQANIKNQGSPQAMQVDGYEALRDGRTVYVNAANILGNNFYTNIYLLSFSQSAEKATQDIFSQLLSHWKFNSNIPLENKDNVRRDVKRLADLAEIKSVLANYQKNHNGDYPSLAAGSYVAGKSVSVWPSWQATLGKELGIILPVDPNNKLGACPGYNNITCWNQTNKSFVDSDENSSTFDLPSNSQAYIYTYNGKGSYNICALMQSGYLTDLSQGACPGSAVGHEVTCTDTVWTPRYNPATICSNSNSTITETSNCGRTRNILHGTKTDTIWTPSIALNLVCSNQTVTETGDCGATRNITHGTKTDTIWTPSIALNLVCSNQTVTETGDCGATRNITHGTKTDGGCCVPTNPSCTAANTCVGQTCNTGCATVNGAKTDGGCCTPTSPNCAASTCVGQTCNTGCATVNGAKTDGGCGSFLFKIVLRWTRVINVRSHLIFSAAGVAYHIYSEALEGGGSILEPNKKLPNDGLETITIKSAEAGIQYSYYVSNAGNRTFRDVVNIQLFDESGALIHEFIANPPLTPQDMTHANLWNVFSFIPSVGASSLVIQNEYIIK